MRYLSVAVKKRALASIDRNGGYTCPCSNKCKPTLASALEDVAFLAGQPALTTNEKTWLLRARRCKASMRQFGSVEALQVGRYYGRGIGMMPIEEDYYD